MGRRKKGTHRQAGPVAILIMGSFFAAVVGGLGYLFYVSEYLPRSYAREFLGLVASDRVAEASARLAPANRKSYPEAKLREFGTQVRGYSDIDWGRKSSMGSTRGGRTTASTSGYLQFPNTKAERNFNISIVKELDGVWYVSSFSLGDLREPY